MTLTVVNRPIGELRLDPGNPRSHPKKQIEQLAASIREFGFVNPVLTDEHGCIIAGHGRMLAAKRLGLDLVPTIALSGLTNAQKRALRVADNRIAQNSGWDADLLKIELEAVSMPEVSIDLSLLGFSPGEIDMILSPDAGDPDDVLPTPPTPRTQPGDIWVLGQHRVGCGDAHDEAFVRRVMGPDVLADAAFLDLPFNVSIAVHAGPRSGHREFATASGEMTAEDYTEFLHASLAVAAGVSRDGAVHFVCMDWRHMNLLSAVGGQLYGALLNLCVWNKSKAGMGSLYRSQHELVFVYRVGNQNHVNAIELGRHGRHRTNLWDYPLVTSPRGSRRSDLELYPTTKPVAMVADAIKDVTSRRDVVLDLFLGAGATLIAAERTERRCRGVEIDPAYVDIAIERWASITGLEPTRQPLRRRIPRT